MRNRYALKLLLIFLSLTLNLFAIEGKIKVFISSDEAIYTSQKMTVSVELLSSAFSITDAKITFPASKKYIVQAPKSAAYLGQEEVGDEDWQMVHYEYEVYALQAGKVEIPSVLVTFTASMGYGQPKKEFALKSEAVRFNVKSPEGVKANKFVLVTDNYELETQMKPEKKQLIVGDAVELSIVQKAKGVPDILFTPVHYKSNAFLRVYEKEPVLKSELKGKYDVSRTDSITLVANGEGNVTLPQQEVLWWNGVTKELHVEKTPAYVFEIKPDPQIAIDAKKARQKQIVIYVIAILLLFVGFYLLFASKINAYRKKRKLLYEESETGHFNRLLLSTETAMYYKNFYAWLNIAEPRLARGGFRAISEIQPSFEESLEKLEEDLASKEQVFDKITFINEAKKLRSTLLIEQKQSALPLAINPQ